MKGGQTPIHIMRWAPADYVNDPFVKLLVARRDFGTFAFYNLVLNWSHMEGGDLPENPEELAAVIGMSVKDTARSLKVCMDAGKLIADGGRIYHKRVRREVYRELQFRLQQSDNGKRGGAAAGKGRPKASPNGALTEPSASPNPRGPNPPSPSPAPYAVAAEEPRRRLDLETADAIREARWAEERELLSTVGRIVELSGKDGTEVMRTVTAYKARDGTVMHGKSNPALLQSAERVTKSLADAKAWLADLEGKREAGRAGPTRHGP